jgi:hypothetical protein
LPGIAAPAQRLPAGQIIPPNQSIAEKSGPAGAVACKSRLARS